MEASLAVTFQEPEFPEPTVGGLTGEQLSLLRVWDDENRCDFEIFPVSPKGPAERCLEPKAENSTKFCEDHLEEWLWRQTEPTYDQYDCYIDRDNE